MADLVIFGTGDIARLADRYFTKDSAHRVVGFTVDAAYRTSAEFLGRPLVDFESLEQAYPPDAVQLFVAVSYARMNHVRAEKYFSAKQRGYVLASYISTRCTILTDEPVGDNCFILEDNTIQPFVRIGSNVTLWSGNHIGHDSVVEDHCFVSSHVVVSGRVVVGEYCFLGVNATIRNGIRIAPRTLVGAGATILHDTEPGGVYVSRPATKTPQASDQVEL